MLGFDGDCLLEHCFDEEVYYQTLWQKQKVVTVKGVGYSLKNVDHDALRLLDGDYKAPPAKITFEKGIAHRQDFGYWEPPGCTPEPVELLIVRPRLRVWGKGA